MSTTTVAEIQAKLDLDDKKFTSGLNSAEGKVKGFAGKLGSGIKSAAKVAAVGLAAAGAAAVAFGVTSVKAYNASVEASTKLETNLLAVKGNTLDNVKSLKKLASQLQKVGVIEDDVIIAGMSQLSTFSLQGKTIEKLTPKITDMVAQLKGHNATAEDMVAINNLVGKVMTGNIGALSRYGVTLSDTQKKQMESANETDRAAMLVKVLSQNYGKVNEALAKTPQGMITRLKNSFGDLQEEIGGALSKALTPFVEKLLKWSQSETGQKQIQEFAAAVAILAEKIGKFLEDTATWFLENKDKIIKVIRDIKTAIQGIITFLASPLGKIVLTLVGGTAILIKVAQIAKAIKGLPGITNPYVILITIAIGEFIFVKKKIDEIKKTLSGIKDKKVRLQVIVGAVSDTGQQLTKLNWGSLLGPIGNLAVNVGKQWKNIFRASGGPVSSKKPYIVGEQGPEWFIPKTSGNILPNGTMPSNITNNIYGNIELGDKSAVDAFFAKLNRNGELARKGLATYGG